MHWMILNINFIKPNLMYSSHINKCTVFDLWKSVTTLVYFCHSKIFISDYIAQEVNYGFGYNNL